MNCSSGSEISYWNMGLSFPRILICKYFNILTLKIFRSSPSVSITGINDYFYITVTSLFEHPVSTRITYWKLYDSSSFLTIIFCSCEWIGIPISRQDIQHETIRSRFNNFIIFMMTSCTFLRIFNALKRKILKVWL